MISEFFKRDQFIQALMEKDYLEILRLAELEVDGAERLIRPANKLRAKAAADYSAFLKAFLFFMRYGIKPGEILDKTFNYSVHYANSLFKKSSLSQKSLMFFEAV